MRRVAAWTQFLGGLICLVVLFTYRADQLGGGLQALAITCVYAAVAIDGFRSVRSL